MGNFVVSCCSTVDLTREYVAERDIRFTCLSYEMDGNTYKDDMGLSMKVEDLYGAMENGSVSKTSQLNVDEYKDYFRSILAEGKDILHLTLSSGLSSTYNSARIAAQELAEEYPERKVIVIDSLAASSGHGLLVDKAADLRDEGMSLQEAADWIENNKQRLHHWFFSTTLKYYIRGGRVSKTAGYIGEMLGICPLLHVDSEGHLIPMEKIRPKKKVILRTVEKMLQYADDGENYDGKCFISHSASMEDAKALQEMICARFPRLKEPPRIFNIGAVIGSHSGPGTVALFFWGQPRNELEKK